MNDAIPRTAPDWIGRLNAPDCTAEDRAAFERWLRASPDNRAAYERCEKIWTMPRQLAEHSDVFAKLVARANAVPNNSRLDRRAWAMAAGLAAIAIGVSIVWLVVRGSPGSARIAAIEQRAVALPDGSNVTLSSNTTIALGFTATERRVEMTGREAFFDVVPDPARPFVVHAGNSEVRVVGTQFNLRNVHGELEVVVRQGKVNVVPDSTVAPTAVVPRVELTPGNRLRMKTLDNQVTVGQVDAERFTAWRTGMIRFEAIALEEVIEDVNRYTEKPFVIADERLRGLPVSGRFRVGDSESVRFLLRERFDIESTVEPDRIVLR